MKKVLKYLILSLLLVVNSAYSDEEEGAKKAYYKLSPDFVVNYGDKGSFRFIRTEISLRVADSKLVRLVRRHDAYIRNNIILLLSAQKVEDIKNPAHREKLKTQLLTEVRQLMEKLEDKPCVEQLYFNNFIVQT